MNNLSWLLYWADVVPKIANALGIVATIGGFSFLAWGMATGFSYAVQDTFDTDATPFRKKIGFVPYVAAFMVLFGVLVPPFMPSKDTLYAIAASEVAEEIVTNEKVVNTTTKAFEAVDAWLDKQIEGKKSNDEAR